MHVDGLADDVVAATASLWPNSVSHADEAICVSCPSFRVHPALLGSVPVHAQTHQLLHMLGLSHVFD